MADFTPPVAPIGPGPAYMGAAVTKSDSTVLSPTRYLWVGGAGDLTVTMADGNDVTIPNVAVGDVGVMLGLSVIAVKDATTATDIVAFW